MTQKARILRHLSKCTKRGITSAEAFNKYGITDLPKRISELRRDGVAISDEYVHSKNRYGDYVKFKRYTLTEGTK